MTTHHFDNQGSLLFGVVSLTSFSSAPDARLSYTVRK